MRIYIFLLAILTFVVLSHAEKIPRTDSYRGYSGDVQLQVAVKLSSADTNVPYWVGKTAVKIAIPETWRGAFVQNVKYNTKDVFLGFEVGVSTMVMTPGKITPGTCPFAILEPGDYFKVENFMGNIYAINEDLSQSSSCVVVSGFIQEADYR